MEFRKILINTYFWNSVVLEFLLIVMYSVNAMMSILLQFADLFYKTFALTNAITLVDKYSLTSLKLTQDLSRDSDLLGSR